MSRGKKKLVYADFLGYHCDPIGTIYVSEGKGKELLILSLLKKLHHFMVYP